MVFDQLGLFDYFVASIVLLSVILGLWRGFVREFIALLAWTLAVLCGILFSPWLASYLQPALKSLLFAHLIAFFIILGAVLLLGWLINAVIVRLTTNVTIGFINRPLGALFGLARGVIIAALIVLLLGHTALKQSAWFEQSVSTQYLEKVNSSVNAEYHKIRGD